MIYCILMGWHSVLSSPTDLSKHRLSGLIKSELFISLFFPIRCSVFLGTPACHWRDEVYAEIPENSALFSAAALKDKFATLTLLIYVCSLVCLLTSVAMMHSFLSSVITKTDWYIESLGEHIADILHSGFSLKQGREKKSVIWLLTCLTLKCYLEYVGVEQDSCGGEGEEGKGWSFTCSIW